MDFSKLAQKNCEVYPEITEKVYGELVSKKFRRKYPQDKAEAVINNYLSDPANTSYLSEFIEMQSYRTFCKSEAKNELNYKKP